MGLEIERQVMATEKTGIGRAGGDSPFERIKQTNTAGNEFWSSRDFAQVLGYSDYRNFEQVSPAAR
jgi:hypothetical protein